MSSLFLLFFFFFSFQPLFLMVDHLNPQCLTNIPIQKKKGFSLRDITKVYRPLFALRLWRRRKKTPSSDDQCKKSSSDESHIQHRITTIDESHNLHRTGEPFQGPKNVERVRSNRYGGDGFREESPKSSRGCFKHRTMDSSLFSSTPSSISRNASRRSPSPSPRPSFVYRSGNLETLSRSSSRMNGRSGNLETLSRSSSRMNGNNPIMFSNSNGMVKPPTIERQLECTLEELCYGCTKKIKITRDVLAESGQIVQEEELLSINVMPGWKKGTKITFEGKGNERLGYNTGDVTFVIAEKRHQMFKREGDNLELAIEIPLVEALTGCSLSIPLLGGKTMKLEIDEIVHPGYQRIITGEGMTSSKEEGSRGNLKVVFLINFPTELTDEQRAAAVSILGDSG